MRYLLHILFATVFFAAHSQTETLEQTLIKLEDQRLKAIINRDSITLSNLYDVSYQGILPSGRTVNKAGVIEYQLSTNPNNKISIEDVKATVYGNFAVTTGKQVNKSKSGAIFGRSKFTRIYVKKDNAWKIISSQGTLVIEDEM